MAQKRRGRGEGSIEELPSGKWRAVLSHGIDSATGNRRKLQETFETKKDALAWLRDRQSEQGQGRLATAGKMTVAEWMTKWLEIKKGKVSDGSWDIHEQHVRLHLKPYVGSLQLSQLRPMHVADFYAKLNGAGVSAAMQSKVGTTFRMALKDAQRLQLLAGNPAAAVARPIASKPAIVVWNAEQVRRFLSALVGDRLESLFVLALDSGMRQGELFGLHWPEVDFDAGAISVTQALSERRHGFQLKAPKTKAGRRRISLTPETLAALNAHRQRMLSEGRNVKTGPVFVDTDGGFLRQNNVDSRNFSRAIKKAGVPAIRFHDMRHTSATLLLLGGVNIKAVSVRLGHSSITITLDTYSHFMPEMDAQAVQVVRKAIFAG